MSLEQRLIATFPDYGNEESDPKLQNDLEDKVLDILKIRGIACRHVNVPPECYELPDIELFPGKLYNCFIECKVRNNPCNLEKWANECTPRPDFSKFDPKTSFMIDELSLQKHDKYKPCVYILHSKVPYQYWAYSTKGILEIPNPVRMERVCDSSNSDLDKAKRVVDLGSRRRFNTLEESIIEAENILEGYYITRNKKTYRDNIDHVVHIWNRERASYYRNMDIKGEENAEQVIDPSQAN